MFQRMTLVLAMALMASFVSAREGQWTGYVTDSHCKKTGANARHTWASLEKCVKGGAKPVLWTEKDEAFVLDDAQKVRDVVGRRVTVSGSLDEKTQTITIRRVEVVP